MLHYVVWQTNTTDPQECVNLSLQVETVGRGQEEVAMIYTPSPLTQVRAVLHLLITLKMNV
jgi:hypothetical protein